MVKSPLVSAHAALVTAPESVSTIDTHKAKGQDSVGDIVKVVV